MLVHIRVSSVTMSAVYEELEGKKMSLKNC